MDDLVKALAEIAARLERIEAAMNARTVTDQGAVKSAVTVMTYTPRELAQKVGRSYRWVIDRCAAGIIPTVSKRRPYLIPAGAADAMFSAGEGLFEKPARHAIRLRGFKPKAAKKSANNPLTHETATNGNEQQSSSISPSEAAPAGGLNLEKAV